MRIQKRRAVLEKAQKELINYVDSDMSVMELSYRSGVENVHFIKVFPLNNYLFLSSIYNGKIA
jgi:hypothetical protein